MGCEPALCSPSSLQDQSRMHFLYPGIEKGFGSVGVILHLSADKWIEVGRNSDLHV